MPRVVVIRNPASRRASARGALEAACAVLDASWDVEIVDSTLALGVSEIARDAALAGVDYVLACGGDGTLHEVVNGVASAGRSEVIVGLIPAGTANVWAQEARIPSAPIAALRLLADGAVVPVDLGRVQAPGIDRRFLLMCSLGLDAAVVDEVVQRPHLKRRLAQVAYAVAGAGVLRRYAPVPVEIDGEAAGTVGLIVAGNSRVYGGVVRLTGDARMDDGQLDLAVLGARPGRRRWVDLGRHVVEVLVRALPGAAGHPRYRRAPAFTLVPGARVGVQADGEFLGYVEAGGAVRLHVEPRALRVLVPPAESPLYRLPIPPAGTTASRGV